MLGFDRFGLARFSLGSEDNTIPLAQDFEAGLNCVAGVAVPVTTTAFFASTLQGKAQGAIKMLFVWAVEEEFIIQAQPNANVIIGQTFPDSLEAGAEGIKDIRTTEFFSDSLNARPYAGKDMPMVPIALPEGLSAKGEAGKDILTQLLAAGVLTTLTSAITQETERVMIQVTLPPGGELRIDSDTYRVLLDGENALHLQNGDWITLTRSLQYLDVESATGGALSGNLIYTERYL